MAKTIHRLWCFIQDTLLPLPVGYYLVIHDDCLQFLKVRPGGVSVISEQVEPFSIESLERFIDSLQSSDKLPILPLAILLDGSHCFTAGWLQHTFTRERIVECANSVTHPGAEVSQTMVSLGREQLLIFQGIRKGVLLEVQAVVRSRHIQVLFVSTLVGYLLLTNLKKLAGHDRSILCSWSANKWTYFGFNSAGALYSGAWPIHDPSDVYERTRWLKSTYGVTGDAIVLVSGRPTVKVNNAQPKRQVSLPIHPVSSRPASHLQSSDADSRIARLQSTVLGSIKLFNIITVALLSLLFLWFASLKLLSEPNETALHQFQLMHTDQSMLQRSVDSLSHEIRINGDNLAVEGASALLAALCQEQVAGAALTGVVIRPGADSALAEIAGTSVDDDSAFDLVAALRRSCAPYQIHLTSIRPEAVSRNGILDTLMTLRLVITRGDL